MVSVFQKYLIHAYNIWQNITAKPLAKMAIYRQELHVLQRHKTESSSSSKIRHSQFHIFF